MPAEFENRATVVDELFEWNTFRGQFEVDCGSRLAGEILSAHWPVRDGLEIFGDEFCSLPRDVVERLLVDIERRLCAQRFYHLIDGAIATSNDSRSSPVFVTP